MSNVTHRTQQERRTETIGKLLKATIECLIELGYRDTSIGKICTRAGVSHGGLFRHFPSRTALIAAATHEIVLRHLSELAEVVHDHRGEGDIIEVLIKSFRVAARAPLTCAWREVLLAARTNAELRDAVAPAVQNFEDAIMDLSSKIPGAPDEEREFGTLVLSILHMFDSEAICVPIVRNQDVLDLRNDWAVKLLRGALKK